MELVCMGVTVDVPYNYGVYGVYVLFCVDLTCD